MKIGVAKNNKKTVIFINNKNKEIHPLWLRERVNNPELLDQNNRQRLYEPSDLNRKIKIQKALINKKNLKIKFSDGIETKYQIKDLIQELNKNKYDSVTLWKGNIRNKPIFKYKKNMFKRKEGYRFLKSFYKYGFAIVKGASKEKNFVIRFANSIGLLRPTNFGNLFNVKSVKKASDLAYTSHALSVHTDNPYRKPIPGIQILHCIKNDSVGGNSTLTDGFSIAEYIRKKFPKTFNVLTKIKIRFSYQDKNTFLENWGKIIELDENQKTKRVRLSPRLDYVPALKKNQLDQFYKARTFFIKLCNSKKFMINFKLEPGDILIMDNYRTLHGRTSYSIKTGERHLQGCYIDHDSAQSKMKFLKKNLKLYA
tara:strand:+ start:60 stop:1163 length:1104 start_codon:yes stop_codon:yes gene_type:complete